MAKKDIVCPIEDIESELFTQWLELNRLEVSWHIPNETPTKRKIVDEFWRTKWVGGWNTNAKNKRKGVKKWIPDHLIVIPADLCTEDRDLLLFVEMKRQNGVPSDVKPEQRVWLEALAKVADVDTFVAFGAKPAMEFVGQYLKNPKMFQF